MKLARTRFGLALAMAAMAITASITAVASPAYAAEDVGEGGHCVATTQDTSQRCFATYDEAKAYVSSIAEISPGKRSDGGTLGFQSGALNAGTQLFGWRLIFIGFDWEYYVPFGGSLWVITNGPACTGPTSNIDYQVWSLPARWNDDISSYLDYSNCWTKLYQHINFGGNSRGYTGDSPTLGDFNNIASSIRWS
jgi:hypothetical protein